MSRLSISFSFLVYCHSEVFLGWQSCYILLNLVKSPSGQIGTKQQQPQQHSLCVYMPVATAAKYSRLIQICASIWTATLAVINVRHAAALSRGASPCSDTRVAADQNRSPAMFAIAGLRGNGVWISTKEPCSVVPHLNRGANFFFPKSSDRVII